MNPKVDWYFQKAEKWKKELEQLRRIILECQLTEELKWGVPCYTFGGHNIVLIHDFKGYCAVLFHKGALLKDAENLLIQQTKNVQAARQMRFTSVEEIGRLEPVLKAYIFEAVENEEAGQKVEMKPTTEFEMPEEFRTALGKDADLKQAFDALTPGRQRGYLLHFSSAKQAATREARIGKSRPQILAGKGLHD